MEQLGELLPDRARRRLRRRGAEDPGGARRRPLRARRPEAVHLRRRRRRSLRRHGADRRRGAVRHLDARRRPATRPASRFGANERKMGWNAQPTRAVIFDGARVPVENRLGPEGIGFKIAMAGLDGGRLNIAACSVGGAQAAFDKALGYMRERRAFGKALTEFQALQFRLADMATELEAARLFLYAAAAAYDRDEPDTTMRCAMAKRFAHRHRLQGRERRPPAPRRLRLSLRVRHREDRPRPARPPDPRGHERDHARDRREEADRRELSAPARMGLRRSALAAHSGLVHEPFLRCDWPVERACTREA